METRTQAPTQEESAIVELVARIVSRVRGPKPDYARLAAELEPAIPFDVFGIVLLRHDREAVRVIVCTRDAGTWVARYHQHPLKDSMFEHILQRGETASNQEGTATATTWPRMAADLAGTYQVPAIEVHCYPHGLDGSPAQSGDALSGKPYLHTTLIAPLKVEDRVLGSLELGSTCIDAYTDQTLQRLISAVARVLAAAIESAQAGGNVEIQDRQREELKNVSSALTSEMDLPMILNRIVVGIAKALNVASAIVTLDRRRNSLKLEVQHGLDPAVLKKLVGREIAFADQAIIGFTLRHRKPSMSNDIAQDSRFPASHLFASQLGIRSIFSYPLVIGSTACGALLVCSPEPGGFTPLKLDILSLFASQAKIALHNGMLLEAARERRRFQEAVEQLDEALQQNSSAGTVEQEDLALLKKVSESSERTFGVSFSSLLHFISEHLLTRSERNEQDVLHAFYDGHRVKDANYNAGAVTPSLQEERTITEQVRDEKNKSVFLSTVSHDLRTPLTTIKAAVTGLLQPNVVWDEQVRFEILKDIDAEADHLYNLVNSLIEMSRIDMGALVLEKEWCDLVEIVHRTLAHAQRILVGHPVHTNFQAQLPLVKVDYVQLERVLHNLIENAVRYSPENAEIVIAVDSIAGQNPGIDLSAYSHQFLRVQIIDHGDGVPEEERERIFKPFYSLDSQGSGLGLAICRGIIEAHQGRIWVEPAPDGGSCFVIILPISS